MLIDEVIISVKAGDGGHGRVAFRKTPGMKGPTGGNGGRGGDVYAEGVSDLLALRQFRNQKDFGAEDGEDGGMNRREGKDGEHLILKLPVGTIIRRADGVGESKEVTAVGERLLLAQGGGGGRGNYEFRSSTNTTPLYSTNGAPGEYFELLIELQMIADIGLIGLPNAGKSSLLNELTAATSRVGAYPFTTLEPSLGILTPSEGPRYGEQIILADIPGLIEGASDGKGLGAKFLRHVARTRMLAHCISVESEDPLRDYETIRKELGKHSGTLLTKHEVILLTKTDLVSPEDVDRLQEKLAHLGKDVIPVSIHDTEAIDRVIRLFSDLEL